ncbi:YihY/virulence factor BrkB family protein [Ulvibacter antarcticus]|uniref:Membrane protein n=1 Tax=Ulvibacter antarcticus TaxID=442714 RepID=A0A3L9YBF6_9FLAO|nr:YihY/virulence factor BrkB family protein [Ulvibacter antarcticus]RMA57704.1 membrane protein [Ulvibacter antarcticus]
MKEPIPDETLKRHFKFKDLPSLLITTAKSWFNSEPFEKSAVVAYYAILSLPGLVIIILNVVGAIWGREIVQGELLNEITKALGTETAETIRVMMVERGDTPTSVFATVIGVTVLLYGATGVFFQVQNALDKIWEAKPRFTNSIIETIFTRFKSFGFILIVGFLLLISFVLTSALSAFGNNLKRFIPESLVEFVYIFDVVISLSFIYFLFAAMFKILPNATIPWRAVRIGAALTSLLFAGGKYLLAIYFSELEPGSTYGTAGSLILIMLWVSYSSLILFFGAHFTKAYSEKYLRNQPKQVLQ